MHIRELSREACFSGEKKKTTADRKEQHVDGSPDIFPHSHTYHVPLFILSVSILEVRHMVLGGQSKVSHYIQWSDTY